MREKHASTDIKSCRDPVLWSIRRRDTEELNKVLHQYGQYIVGRMGINPGDERNVNIISVVIDAPGDVISALSGKLGMLRGISSKALYSKAPEAQE